MRTARAETDGSQMISTAKQKRASVGVPEPDNDQNARSGKIPDTPAESRAASHHPAGNPTRPSECSGALGSQALVELGFQLLCERARQPTATMHSLLADDFLRVVITARRSYPTTPSALPFIIG
jgi:hypothetical protein